MFRGMGVNLQESRKIATKADQDLASQRRIFEAEQAQKEAMQSSEELQSTVLRWLPRVGIAVAVAVAGYFVVTRMRKGK